MALRTVELAPVPCVAPADAAREGTTPRVGWKHELRLLLLLRGTLALMAKATVPRPVARVIGVPYPPRPGAACIWSNAAVLCRWVPSTNTEKQIPLLGSCTNMGLCRIVGVFLRGDVGRPLVCFFVSGFGLPCG